MKKFLILFVLTLVFCGGNSEAENNIEVNETTEVTEMTYDKTYSSPPTMTINVESSYTAEIETSSGSITIDLFTDVAPNTVNNFVTLSNDG